MNALPIFYHSGATYDLDLVISHAAKNYSNIHLIGFSLGANLTLKYLGETSWKSKIHIKKAVAISVPLDLGGSCDKIDEFGNKLYAYNFLYSLKQKIRKKLYTFRKNYQSINSPTYIHLGILTMNLQPLCMGLKMPPIITSNAHPFIFYLKLNIQLWF